MLFSTEERVDRLEFALEKFISESNFRMAELNTTLSRQERNLDRRERDTERKMAQLDRSMEEAREETKALKKQMGDLGNRLGTIIEDIIVPSIRRISRDELNCGNEIAFSSRYTKTRPDGTQREFDALYVGEKAILLNESKVTARLDYAKEFVESLQNKEFFQYFPEYQGKIIKPVFSALNVADSVTAYLTKQGVYVVAMGDDVMHVVNKSEVEKK